MAHPALSIAVVVVDPSSIGEELRSGRNDFGVLFVDGRVTGVKVHASFRTAVGAVMRPDHPLAKRRRVSLTECASYPVMMLHDRWLLDAIMDTEFAKSGAKLEPRLVSNSIEFMRQCILSGLGIGFFTPVGFADEIKRGELVHVPLAEPELGDSQIGVIVPASQPLSVPARIALDVVAASLDAFAKKLPAPRGRRA
jgi:DNA-binding transcriptional LysR family regulator